MAMFEEVPRESPLKFISLGSCQKFRNVTFALDNLQSLDLSSMPNLSTINLDCPQLRTLNISNSKMLREIQVYCQSLDLLNMSGCQNLLRFEGEIGPTRTLNMYNCRSLSIPSLLTLIGSTQGAIEDLSLTGLIQLTDDALREIRTLCPNLLNLDVSGCKQLSR